MAALARTALADKTVALVARRLVGGDRAAHASRNKLLERAVAARVRQDLREQPAGCARHNQPFAVEVAAAAAAAATAAGAGRRTWWR